MHARLLPSTPHVLLACRCSLLLWFISFVVMRLGPPQEGGSTNVGPHGMGMTVTQGPMVEHARVSHGRQDGVLSTVDLGPTVQWLALQVCTNHRQHTQREIHTLIHAHPGVGVSTYAVRGVLCVWRQIATETPHPPSRTKNYNLPPLGVE